MAEGSVLLPPLFFPPGGLIITRAGAEWFHFRSQSQPLSHFEFMGSVFVGFRGFPRFTLVYVGWFALVCVGFVRLRWFALVWPVCVG